MKRRILVDGVELETLPSVRKVQAHPPTTTLASLVEVIATVQAGWQAKEDPPLYLFIDGAFRQVGVLCGVDVTHETIDVTSFADHTSQYMRGMRDVRFDIRATLQGE